MSMLASLRYLPEHLPSSLLGCFTTTPNPRLLRERLRYFLTKRFHPFLTPCGYLIENEQQLISWWEICHEQRLFSQWHQRVWESDLILDIGANHGIFGWECRKRWGHKLTMVGFEPFPSLTGYLNKLSVYDAVEPVALVASTSGQAPVMEILYTGTHRGLTGSTEPCYATSNSAVMVATRTLDSYKLRPQWIKMDVDGTELRVIAGGMETFSQAIGCIIETVYPKRVSAICNLIGKRHIKRLTSIDYLFT